eukprot:gene17500-9118_t
MSLFVANIKPPNIVVFSRKPDSLTTWRSLLQTVLSQEAYVIYSLPEKDFVKDYWKSNTVMLVLDQIKLDYLQKEQVDSYVFLGGKVFSHCSTYPVANEVSNLLDPACSDKTVQQGCIFSSYDREIEFQGTVVNEIKDSLGSYTMEALCKTISHQHPVVNPSKFGNGLVVTSALNFQSVFKNEFINEKELGENGKSALTLLKMVFEALGMKCLDPGSTLNIKLTPGHVYGDRKIVAKFIPALKARIEERHGQYKDKSRIVLLDEKHSGSEFPLDVKHFHIIVPDDIGKISKSDEKFNYATYKFNLKSETIGRLLVYSNVVSSTQSIVESIVSLLSGPNGLVVAAGQQTQGKGRGGNVWLSPFGCMMFSVLVQIPSSSLLGQRMPFLQHIAAVAFVRSVRSKEGYEDINVRIKWPNDIYVGDSIKIGGLIVNSSYMDGKFSAVIGIGVNVKNKKPTICLNSVIDEHNKQKNTHLEHFCIEELVAATLSNIEKIMAEFEEYGVEEFCKIYCKYWLHSNQAVKIEADDEEVIIKGLDTNGFLLVESKDRGFLSLQPDGNSFDMMKGLIKIKERT